MLAIEQPHIVGHVGEKRGMRALLKRHRGKGAIRRDHVFFRSREGCARSKQCQSENDFANMHVVLP